MLQKVPNSKTVLLVWSLRVCSEKTMERLPSLSDFRSDLLHLEMVDVFLLIAHCGCSPGLCESLSSSLSFSEVLYRPTNKFSVAAPRPAIHPNLSGSPYDTNVQHRDSHQYLGKANVNHFQGNSRDINSFLVPGADLGSFQLVHLSWR